MKEILVKNRLGNSHYRFISGLSGVSIKRFSFDENFNEKSPIYIVSEILLNKKSKLITSTLNPYDNTIEHRISNEER